MTYESNSQIIIQRKVTPFIVRMFKVENTIVISNPFHHIKEKSKKQKKKIKINNNNKKRKHLPQKTDKIAYRHNQRLIDWLTDFKACQPVLEYFMPRG